MNIIKQQHVMYIYIYNIVIEKVGAETLSFLLIKQIKI